MWAFHSKHKNFAFARLFYFHDHLFLIVLVRRIGAIDPTKYLIISASKSRNLTTAPHGTQSCTESSTVSFWGNAIGKIVVRQKQTHVHDLIVCQYEAEFGRPGKKVFIQRATGSIPSNCINLNKDSPYLKKKSNQIWRNYFA